MSFPDFARAVGLTASRYIDDGRVHRCPTAAHPRKRNGAYRWDGEWGWCQDWANHVSPVVWRSELVPTVQPRFIDHSEARRAEAKAREAATIVAKCSTAKHRYLGTKGFADHEGLVDFDGRLVVPMRSCADYKRIQSLQWITADGEKKFMPGAKARGGVFMLGPPSDEYWLCEGYATGLSVQAGLSKLFRRARVVICFSAGNLAHVAARLTGQRFVVADNDESGTGERVARSTGLPWVMPPDIGTDANDFHQREGAFALAGLLRTVL